MTSIFFFLGKFWEKLWFFHWKLKLCHTDTWNCHWCKHLCTKFSVQTETNSQKRVTNASQNCILMELPFSGARTISYNFSSRGLYTGWATAAAQILRGHINLNVKTAFKLGSIPSRLWFPPRSSGKAAIGTVTFVGERNTICMLNSCLQCKKVALGHKQTKQYSLTNHTYFKLQKRNILL